MLWPIRKLNEQLFRSHSYSIWHYLMTNGLGEGMESAGARGSCCTGTKFRNLFLIPFRLDNV